MKNDYYTQEVLWGKGIKDYQYQVLKTIENVIPDDVDTILDVGCGDGYITNVLAEKYIVTGMDVSEEALKYIKCETCVGNIIDIPFPDKSFDLIVINDVLEHIEDEYYQQALSELVRVSRKYVLVTVPNEEDIDAKSVICNHCGCVFHVNLHQRSYDKRKMLHLFESYEFITKAIIYTGEIENVPYNPYALWQQRFDVDYEYSGALCPKCGRRLEKDIVDKGAIYAIRQHCWDECENYCNRSEIMGIYSRTSNKLALNFTGNKKDFSEGRIRDIDFLNPLQKVVNICEGGMWARWQSVSDICVQKSGISVQNERDGYIRLYFPYLGIGDALHVIGLNLDDSVKLVGVDGITGIEVEMVGVSRGEGEICFKIDKIWNPNRFGYQLDSYFAKEVILKGITYQGNTQNAFEFWHVQEGFNLVEIGNIKGSVILNSFFGDIQGRIPVMLGSHKAVSATLSRLYKEITTAYDVSIDLYKDALNRISSAFNADADKYNQERMELYKEINEAKVKIDETRVKYQNEKKEFINMLLNRKHQKILVLSNMFPSKDNEINGCFVHEQVRFLRKYCGLDVRVVSCKPFWINTFNPIKAFRAKQAYEKAINGAQWEDYRDVPVMYLPYKVGTKYPHKKHSTTYSQAILKKIAEIYQDYKFDMIHAHTSYLDGNAARMLSTKYQIPYVITEHTGPFSILTNNPIVKKKTLHAIKNADKVWAVSDSLRRTMLSSFSDDLSPQQIDVLYNGVDMDRFLVNDVPQSSDTINVMYVGYLEEVKNPLNLIAAFSLLHQNNSNVRLKLVGDGTLREAVQEKVAELGLSNVVTMYGLCTREQVAQLIEKECDIFVLPSKAETFGVVLIEAMACGKPIVATKCGGPEGIVTEDIGLLCENDNPESMYNAINSLIINYSKYDANLIRKSAEERFSYKVITRQLSKEYQKFD